jgi:hypothetical protein
MRDDESVRTNGLEDPRAMYLDLLRRSVMGLTYVDESTLGSGGEYRRVPMNYRERLAGHDLPYRAVAFGGTAKFDNLQVGMETCLSEKIPGDFMEAGCWRGGVTIFMRGFLKAYGDVERSVWCADSFLGEPIPKPATYPDDEWNEFYKESLFVASFDDVRETFAGFGLLDDRVKFVRGWFEDTLPTCRVEKLAVVRIDGDLYGSNWTCMEHLYPKVSPGGFVILDDYFVWPAARKAIDDYRSQHSIDEPIHRIAANSGYWRRSL